MDHPVGDLSHLDPTLRVNLHQSFVLQLLNCLARSAQGHTRVLGQLDLLARTGDDAGAADVLERAMYIHPYDAAIHDRMAALYAETGRHAKAVRERRAIVALNPVNRADALYRLAAALFDAGDRAEARRQVLRSLEIAPNYAEAQQLLLRLQGESQ
jgi:tetratricopeptide (TPR) repeat protein